MQMKALFGARLTARKIWVTAVCAIAPRSAAPGGWLLSFVPLSLAAALHSALLVAGCCPSICCSWRLTAALRSATPGGWLLPFDLLPLAAGFCLSICCPWRLAAALQSSAPGGSLLPFNFRVNVEAACYFRHTVSMDLLRCDHDASDTTYVCCIQNPSRAVSRRLWDKLMVGRPRS